jgi:predicted ATPase/DNA-binding winged helix-turn-helix (wHTH) protein
MPQDRVYVSGGWQVDLARRELRADGTPVPLAGRAFDILEVLVQSAGELVTRSELAARLWPNVIVEANTLQVHISAIRRAFGRDGGMLKAVSGRGYRLTGSWTVRRDSALPPVGAPPVPTSGAFRTNLPLPGSGLIGRAQAVQDLRTLLSAYRLVTMTGPGGIGKTSLALEVARGLASGSFEAVLFVELAPLTDPGLVPSAVAGALGVALTEAGTSPEAVAEAVGLRKILLLLDNCEHMIDAVAGLAETLIRRCPTISLVATSRELLRIDGEYAYRVPPLVVPPEDQQAADLQLEYSAVQLFVARMQALQSGFLLQPNDLQAIAAICRRLDGIPLAIELAAARSAMLGVEEVVSRLGDRFALLIKGRRTAVYRQQTLRATLDWSYQLLPETERRLLRHLSVFAGGFTLDAAAAVTGDAADPALDSMTGIANLAEKSLVALDGSVASGRWRLLETTRVYAMEKLSETGEADAAARRHAMFFRDLIGRATGAQPTIENLARCGQEIDNVRTALDWAFSTRGDPTTGVALTAAFVPVWLHLSLMVECTEWVERALESLDPQASLDPLVRLRLHLVLGSALLHATGVADKTGIVLNKALEVAESLNDGDSVLRALWALWSYQYNKGDHRAALTLAERFQAAAERPDDALVGDRLLGITLHYRGEQERARFHLDRMLDQYVAPDDLRHTAWFQHDQRIVTRAMLARVLWLQGFPDQASEAAQASLLEVRQTNHSLSLRYVLGWGVCPVALLTGDFAAAEQGVASLIALTDRHHLPFWKSVGIGLQAQLLIKRGDGSGGAVLLRSTIDASVRAGRPMRFPDFLGVLAEGLASAGQAEAALATVDEALAQAEQGGEHWCQPELLRIKGDVLVRNAEAGTIAAAEACFLEALHMAGQQGALSWSLRAAISLGRLRIDQGRTDDARALVEPLFNRFTEGFETADLRAARTMLDTLDA